MFRIDSKIYEFLTLLVNLVILNILWLVCCVPVITAGAASAAMYRVVFNFLTKQDDAVVKPFLRSFVSGFRQATPIWILQLAVGAMLFAECLYLLGEGNTLLLVVLSVLVAIYLGTFNCYFGLIARYNTGNGRALWNGFVLSMKHPIQTVLIALLNLFPVLLLVLFPNQLVRFGLLWLLIGFSLIALLIAWFMLGTFKKYENTSKNGEDVNA